MTTEPIWRKSTFSGTQGDCVELAQLDEHTMGVRDSKQPDAGHLTLTRG